MEKKTDQQIVQEVMQVLKTIYSNAPSAPANFLISRWQSDPLARGSYSSPVLGSFPSDVIALGTLNLLHFVTEVLTSLHE